jgi:hypothetical protein
MLADTLYAMSEAKPDERLTAEMIDQAAAVAGITILPENKQALLSKLNEQRQAYDAIRKLQVPNQIPPAFRFDPVTALRFGPATESAPDRARGAVSDVGQGSEVEVPNDLEKLAYATIRDTIGGPGTPVSLTFLGRLYDDSTLLAFAAAYQQKTGFQNARPPGFE